LLDDLAEEARRGGEIKKVVLVGGMIFIQLLELGL